MKRMTASQVRQNWFRVLDEVVAGEEVVVERDGVRVVIRREAPDRVREAVPDYGGILRVPDPDSLAASGWRWDGPGLPLRPEEAGEGPGEPGEG